MAGLSGGGCFDVIKDLLNNVWISNSKAAPPDSALSRGVRGKAKTAFGKVFRNPVVFEAIKRANPNL